MSLKSTFKLSLLMQKFLDKTIKDIVASNTNLNNVILIPSSKRASVFIKQVLKEIIPTNSFLPKIVSIDSFIEKISEIQLIDNTELLFQFYTVYLQENKSKNPNSFEEFSAWATTILSDFNELDRYLIDTNKLFNYLSDIRRIENWFEETAPTNLTENYLNYFKNVNRYYKNLQHTLLQQKKGYQGLLYLEAHKKINHFTSKNTNDKFIFIGLNALNKAEEEIIQELLLNNLAEIYFDLDATLAAENPSYGKFITNYKEQWQHYTKNPFKFITNDFINPKQFEIIGVPKNVTQLKEASAILQKIHVQNNDLQNTALVLANESLLPITLNSLPKEVDKVNITMGYPLKNINISSFFSALLHLYKNQLKFQKKEKFYYKDVLAILSDANLQNFYQKNGVNINTLIADKILKANLVFISSDKLINLSDNDAIKRLHQNIFSGFTAPNDLLERIITLIEILLKHTNHALETEYLSRFYNLFNQLLTFNKQYGYLNSIEALEAVYKQLLSSESLSFKGEPLEGLQIMGLLETRNLDFENIIITSVNEGFLPSGKSTPSFIPFDVKIELGLPTYSEKDAIFSYHFFRLLQRAKQIYILYNTETDDFGASEKSRFLLQLEQLITKIPNHQLTQKIVSPIVALQPKKLIEIPKTPDVFKKLDVYNEKKGFSPSALTTYIANPIYFYQQRILGIRDVTEIEETIALNTLGTVIHDVLESFYKPLLNKVLIKEDILKLKKEITERTTFYFKKHVKNGNFTEGKNLLIFEIAKQHIRNFLNLELQAIKQGNEIIVLDVEQELKATIAINSSKKNINLRGIADRIELFNGTVRIIDYKTGTADQSMLNHKNWEFSRTNYKSYSKRFQVLFYAYCYIQQHKINLDSKPLESGIISFKNLKNGFLKVNNKPVNTNDIKDFEAELIWLLEEIYNPNQSFLENENAPF